MAEGQGGSTFDRPRSPEEIAAIELGRKMNRYFGGIEDGISMKDVLPASRDPKSPRWEDILRGTDPIERPKIIRVINVLRKLDHSLKHTPDLVSPALKEGELDLSRMGGLRALSVGQLGRINGAGPSAALVISEAVKRIEHQQPQNVTQESFNRP